MSHADEPTKADKKLRMLEECMRAFLNQGAMGLDMSDLGLVPGVKVPLKFKVLDFSNTRVSLVLGHMSNPITEGCSRILVTRNYLCIFSKTI